MELLRLKGQRSWSVGLSVADLVDTIVNNKKKVHCVSTLAKVTYFHSRVLDFDVFDINHIISRTAVSAPAALGLELLFCGKSAACPFPPIELGGRLEGVHIT